MRSLVHCLPRFCFCGKVFSTLLWLESFQRLSDVCIAHEASIGFELVFCPIQAVLLKLLDANLGAVGFHKLILGKRLRAVAHQSFGKVVCDYPLELIASGLNHLAAQLASAKYNGKALIVFERVNEGIARQRSRIVVPPSCPCSLRFFNVQTQFDTRLNLCKIGTQIVGLCRRYFAAERENVSPVFVRPTAPRIFLGCVHRSGRKRRVIRLFEFVRQMPV